MLTLDDATTLTLPREAATRLTREETQISEVCGTFPRESSRPDDLIVTMRITNVGKLPTMDDKRESTSNTPFITGSYQTWMADVRALRAQGDNDSVYLAELIESTLNHLLTTARHSDIHAPTVSMRNHFAALANEAEKELSAMTPEESPALSLLVKMLYDSPSLSELSELRDNVALTSGIIGSIGELVTLAYFNRQLENNYIYGADSGLALEAVRKRADKDRRFAMSPWASLASIMNTK